MRTRDGSEYDSLLCFGALPQQGIDWLVGITRPACSASFTPHSNVGRVVSPTLALIVQRESEIGAFKPEPFYPVNADFDNFLRSLRSSRTKRKRKGRKDL